MPFSEFAMNVMKHGLPKGLPEKLNPFETVNGNQYLRFDSIKLEIPNDWAGGVLLTYMWQGHEVYHDRSLGLSSPGTLVELRGIEARMGVISEAA